jgi:hypothetical protein
VTTIKIRFAPELIGIACGLSGGWVAWNKAADVLALSIAAASVCAGAIGSLTTDGMDGPGTGPRSGIRAGLLTALLGGGTAVFGATLQSTPSGFATILPAVLTIPPGAFFGVLGALLVSMLRNPRMASAERCPSSRESKFAAPLVAVILLSLCGYVSPLIARIAAPDHSKATDPIPLNPVPSEEPPAIAKPSPPPPPPWEYRAPKDFHDARPNTIKVLTNVSLGRFGAPLRIAFAHDKHTLAFGGENAEIVIVDLNIPEKKKSLWLPEVPERFGFSPDDGRLFCVSNGGRFVASLDSVIPLPLPEIVPPGDIEWTEKTRAYVDSSVIDLETLQVSNAPDRTSKGSATTHANIDLREFHRVIDVSRWNVRTERAHALRDKQLDYSQTVPFPGENPRLSPDGTKVLSTRDGELIATFFELSESRARRFTIDVGRPILPALADALKEKRLLAMLCSPIVNPLNDRVVGADLARVKGTVSFESWDGSKAALWVKEDYGSIVSDRDTIAHLMVTDGERRIHVPEFESWWSIVSNVSASASPKLLPVPEKKPAHTNPPEKTPVGNGPLQEPATAELLRTFIRTHHEKSSRGDVDGLVADYASNVDHLNWQMVSREDIRKEEREYHSPGTRSTETVEGEISIAHLSGALFRAKYTLRYHQIRPSGAWARGVSDVELIIDVGSASSVFAPQIVKQRAVQKEKQNGH